MGNSSKTFGKLTILLLVLPAISFSALPAYAKYGGGTGEPNDPYLIFDANQMNAIGADSNDWDKHFKLKADIDLSGFTGTNFNIIGNFSGVFDGNDHTISNFTYTTTGTNFIGLFRYIDDPNAQIKDLTLSDPNVVAGVVNYVGSLVGWLGEGNIRNCYVEGGSITGTDRIGGLVGGNGYYGTITNCYSTCSVSGTHYVGGLLGWNDGTIANCYSMGSVSGDWPVGGLVGENDGTITNCYSTCSVSGTHYVGGLLGWNDGTITNCYSTASVSGGGDVGGLVGRNDNWGTISDCYSTGSVSGGVHVGGLVGQNGWCMEFPPMCFPGRISNCYATGAVSGYSLVGGLVGKNEAGEIIVSFWDIQTSGQVISGGGTGKTTAEMQTMSTFTDADWDFNTPVWTIDEDVDYPRLWWEFVPVLHAEPEVTLGTSNRISWEPVVGANDYYAECSKDANFTSIIYSSGWIKETNCEFTGLELGKRYWYSVKARNSAGVESQWSNVESSLQGTLADAVDIMLDPDTLKNKNMKNALSNKIDEVLEMIDDGLYTDALSKLEHDILAKMNGCGEIGEPDKNDWIITCEEQNELCPLVIETIEYVRGLMEY